MRSPMSKENLVLKLRIEADPQTISELDGQSRICNWLYNHLLEKSLELKREFIHSGNPEASKTLYSVWLRPRFYPKAMGLVCFA